MTMRDIAQLTEQELRDELKEAHRLASVFKVEQLGLKILLNSAYGAVGNNYFRWFDVRLAEAITLSGQLSIRWIENFLNNKFNEMMKTKDFQYVFYADTDSVYLELGPLVEKIIPKGADEQTLVNTLDKMCQKIDGWIAEEYKNLAQYMNAYQQQMFMDREVIATRGFWVAKKRYALLVHDSEGVRYETPKLKIMGIETQRSSTPKICREHMEDAIRIMLEGDNDGVIKYIDDFRKKFDACEPEVIAKPIGCKEAQKHSGAPQMIYKKGATGQAKAALIFNHWVEKLGLEHKYPLIRDGDKIKLVYLKTPNPLKEDVVGFLDVLPEEFGVHKYVDFNKQFETMFLKPVRHLCDAIGWQIEKMDTLDDMFV